MDYTAALRQAHLNTLRQKYLDIMEEARIEKEQKQLQYNDDAQTAYVDKMTGLRDKPQQLRAAGLGGGAEESELEEIALGYQNQLESLRQAREQFLSEYNRVVEVQTRAMNNAIAEYNARIAQQDAAAQGSSKSTGSTPRRKSGGSTSGQKGIVQVSGGKMSAADNKLIPVQDLRSLIASFK